MKQTYALESLEELFLVWNTLDSHGGGGCRRHRILLVFSPDHTRKYLPG